MTQTNEINMEDLKIIDFISKKIIEIWNDDKYREFCTYKPAVVDSVPKDAIIFIGLNASLSEKYKSDQKLDQNKFDFFSYKLNQIKEENYKYYSKFSEIALDKEVKTYWGHIDLLYIQETKQNDVKQILKTPEGIGFIYDQLMISKEVIEMIIKEGSPKLFIVNNTLSRLFMGKDKFKNDKNDKFQNEWMNFEIKANQIKGLEVDTLQGVPIFFTSMLTGQRALDNGSFETLLRNIRFVLKN